MHVCNLTRHFSLTTHSNKRITKQINTTPSPSAALDAEISMHAPDVVVLVNGGGKEDGNHHSSGNGMDVKDPEAVVEVIPREGQEEEEDKGGEEVKAWKPWAATAIVVASVVVFVVEMYANNCTGNGRRCFAGFLGRMSFQTVQENPLLGPSSSTLVKMGALKWSKIIHEQQGWRLISSIWLHAGLAHLILNMLCLILVGVRLEQQFGFVRIGSIYLLSGFGGSISSVLFSRNYVSVSASNTVFGLFGSVFSELIMNWTIYSTKAASLFALLAVIATNLGLGIFPHVDNFGNIGGFVTGFLLGFSLLMRPQLGWTGHHELLTTRPAKSKHNNCQYMLCVVASLLLIHLLAVSLVMLFLGKNFSEGCNWCHYLSCVPTSMWSCAS